jgi:RNA polymerase primary sigma factor
MTQREESPTMKEESTTLNEVDDTLTTNPEVDADEAEASDLLEMIARDAAEPAELIEQTTAKGQSGIRNGPFMLESLYFQSFGDHALLTREEEIALAKRIDSGTRAIRTSLRRAIKLMPRLKRSETVLQSAKTLQMIRRLSGLSATALDRAEESLRALASETKGQPKHAAAIRRQIKEREAEIRSARTTLERAKDELVRRNLRLVVDVAKHYTGRGLSLLDLAQEGNIGLMKAAERYQYRKGFKFSTYATWWVRQGITRALADQSRTIRIPVHQTEASNRILRVSRRLGQRLGRPARLEEVAGALRMRPERLFETVRAFQEPIALESPVGDGNTEFGEMLPDQQAVSPDAHVHRNELTRELDRILSTLTPREQTVIRLRFGIGQDEPRTLEQVGQSLSVTRERIRQIEAKALKKLKAPEVKHRFAEIK